MKKQNFYIFYLENDENKRHANLVKSYMNYFIINEEDQSEITEVHIFEKMTDLEDKLKFLPLHFLFIIDCFKAFLFNFKLSFLPFITIEQVLYATEKAECNDYQTKFIIGMPNIALTQKMISSIFMGGHKVFRFNVQFILLDCHLEMTTVNKNNFQEITNGDDMDILSEEFRKTEFAKHSNDMVSYKLLTLSEIKKITGRYPNCHRIFRDEKVSFLENSEDLCFKLTSKRKSFDSRTLAISYFKHSLYSNFSEFFFICSSLFFECPYIIVILDIFCLLFMTKLFLRQSITFTFHNTTKNKYFFLTETFKLLLIGGYAIYSITKDTLTICTLA